MPQLFLRPAGTPEPFHSFWKRRAVSDGRMSHGPTIVSQRIARCREPCRDCPTSRRTRRHTRRARRHSRRIGRTVGLGCSRRTWRVNRNRADLASFTATAPQAARVAPGLSPHLVPRPPRDAMPSQPCLDQPAILDVANGTRSAPGRVFRSGGHHRRVEFRRCRSCRLKFHQGQEKRWLPGPEPIDNIYTLKSIT